MQSLRALARDNVTARLNSGPMIKNSVLRVMSDTNAGLAYLTLLYLNWLANQLMPDTAETQWLDRFAAIWLANYGGGRKPATFASGSVTISGIAGIPVPDGTLFTGQGSPTSSSAAPQNVTYQSTGAVTVGAQPTTVPLVALTAGAVGNQAASATLSMSAAIAGVNGVGTVVSMTGGVDQETDTQLRARLLLRIQQPPMGGDASDYVQWALSQPGVTRAWCSPGEMGIGTVTLRFMMDELRATPGNYLTNGFPNATDVATLQGFINTVRPVTAQDVFVEAPIPEPVSCAIGNLSDNDPSTLANIAASVNAMILAKGAPASSVNGVAAPGQTIYTAWVSDAIYEAAGVNYFDLVMADHPMPNNGSLAVLGNIVLAAASDYSTASGSMYIPGLSG